MSTKSKLTAQEALEFLTFATEGKSDKNEDLISFTRKGLTIEDARLEDFSNFLNTVRRKVNSYKDNLPEDCIPEVVVEFTEDKTSKKPYASGNFGLDTNFKVTSRILVECNDLNKCDPTKIENDRGCFSKTYFDVSA